MINTPVFVFHGLGGRVWTTQLLIWYLRHSGFTNVHAPHYPVNSCSLDECLDQLDVKMQAVASKHKPILVVGLSMGGVMANYIHQRGWNVEKSVSLAAPLNGAWLYRAIEERLPSPVFEYFDQPGKAYLKRTEPAEPPPHPYTTVAFGSWFDGQVFRNETIIEPEHHVDVWLATHWSPGTNPRVWALVAHQLAGDTKRPPKTEL